jgi:hypothetical protein
MTIFYVVNPDSLGIVNTVSYIPNQVNQSDERLRAFAQKVAASWQSTVYRAKTLVVLDQYQLDKAYKTRRAHER